MELIATCAFGLEAVVSRELAALGYASRVVQTGRLMFEGDLRDICRANLWLRSAERILVHVASIPAGDFDQLFDGVMDLPWEQWIPADGAFPVKGRSHASQLTSVPAVQRSVKKAIVKCLSRTFGELPETGPSFPVEVAVRNDVAMLTIDTTGDGLHKRGYRKLTGQAPLRETLSAALVQLSFWKGDRPLMDPFCGTGTIAIEAALYGRNIAPGLKRSFLAEQWPQFQQGEAAAIFDEERAAAETAIREPLDERIIATDISAEALKMARYHAAQAGVADDIHWQQRDFADLHSKREYGCLITNPPYGQRLGEQREAEQLLATFPLVLRRLPTWSHFVISSNSYFERLIGQKADRRRKLYNGRIECQYYQFHGPKRPRTYQSPESDTLTTSSEDQPTSSPAAADEWAEGAPPYADTPQHERESGRPRDEDPAAGQQLRASSEEPASLESPPASPPETPASSPEAPESSPESPRERESRPKREPRESPTPVFGGLDAAAQRQAAEFSNRLTKRARHLRRWPGRGITCYRLYERDIPEVPLVVDRYEDRLHIAEFDRPHDRTIAGHAEWLDLMAKTAADTLDVPVSHVHMKRRKRQRSTSQYEKFNTTGETLVVHEGGLKFLVNLSDYLDTGLFLDHRITRSMVRDQTEGKRFLNLFSYTGTFTVYAADGGAVETTTVDLSSRYLEWAMENLKANGFVGSQHRTVQADILSYVKSLEAGEQFDVMVVDPPTYSNSKSTEEDWDVQRDYAKLLNLLAAHLSPEGVIFFSTNFRRFKFDELAINLQGREISKHTVPEDFRNRRIHRCWTLKKG